MKKNNNNNNTKVDKLFESVSIFRPHILLDISIIL